MKKVTIMLIGAIFFLSGCSCYSWVGFWGGDPEEECQSHWKFKKKISMAEPAENPCAAQQPARTMRSYPAAGASGNAVRMEKMGPAEVRANEPFDYQIKVTNLTDQQLHNVIVIDRLDENLKIKSSLPAALKMDKEKVHWSLGTLGPSASRTITVNAVAEGKEIVTSCADVLYDSLICSSINIVEPQLHLTKYSPAASLACDRIPLRYVVTNTGTGSACDISVKDTLQKGLMNSKGSNDISFAIDSLAPGESKEFEIMVDAAEVGRYFSKATASSKTGGTVESNMPVTIVSKPILVVKQTCPAKQFIGRDLTYDITLSNNGDGIAKNTVIEAMIPEGAEFKSSTQGGRFTHSSPGKVTWNIGTLQPDSFQKVSMTLSSAKIGSMASTAKAMAYCADTVSSTCETSLSGISAILMEVVDISDPIELGQNETYVITVTNQGSADDTNIQLICTLEAGMNYISSAGPTMGKLLGNTITFSPLSSLAPKTKATWRVVVRAAEEGDIRFKAEINSDQLTRSVEETEATMFYK